MICNLDGHNCSVLSLHVCDTTASSVGWSTQTPPRQKKSNPGVGTWTQSKVAVGQAGSMIMHLQPEGVCCTIVFKRVAAQTHLQNTEMSLEMKLFFILCL